MKSGLWHLQGLREWEHELQFGMEKEQSEKFKATSNTKDWRDFVDNLSLFWVTKWGSSIRGYLAWRPYEWLNKWNSSTVRQHDTFNKFSQPHSSGVRTHICTEVCSSPGTDPTGPSSAPWCWWECRKRTSGNSKRMQKSIILQRNSSTLQVRV